MAFVLVSVAWPYANGPRHIGHVAGFGVPSDVFARYRRMRGDQVLMVSGTDEHGTPIQVVAEAEGITPQEVADKNNRLIVEDLTALGLSYDLFTRTTTHNHYEVTKQMFQACLDAGYLIEQTTLGAAQASTGRTLPDRYIEGICPICKSEGARGDQCDACGNQLDPIDLLEPKSRIDGSTPVFRETTHYFLNLPKLAQKIEAWLDERQKQGWRSNVIQFSRNFLQEIKPRAITRDLDWGVPVPVWHEDNTKRLYVWFDAVVGYLSASIEWARHTGDLEAWRKWWNDPKTSSYFFMGKDNIVFHTQIWPAMVMAHNEAWEKARLTRNHESGDGENGISEQASLETRIDDYLSFGHLNLPSEIVASEFLTMEGKKFTSSRGIVIYVKDMLERYQADALRYYISVAGPESADADFTWGEFVRRTNNELVASWGNLVHRVASMIYSTFGKVPAADALEPVDQELLDQVHLGFDRVGRLIDEHRHRQAVVEIMTLVNEVNRYISTTEPFKLDSIIDRLRLSSILYTLAQVVVDLNTMFSPFLPFSANRIYELYGVSLRCPLPVIRTVEDQDTADETKVKYYPIITGNYSETPKWQRTPVTVGAAITKPQPIFEKLDPKIIDEELERLAQQGII